MSFSNSEETTQILKRNLITDYKRAFGLVYQEKALDRFKIVEELVKEMGGVSSYIIKGDCVVQMKIKVINEVTFSEGG